MTVTSNIHVGLAAWQSSHSYSVLGARVSNGGNAYQVTATGTSAGSGGPSGTGAAITDNTVTWKYLSAISYTSLSAWASSIPGTLTQPIVGLLWNDGTITTTAGTAYLTLSGHTTSGTNTITLTCATGESFRDTMAGGSAALAFNTSNGVSFTLPSGTGNINYIGISDSNVIIDGLQFKDPQSTSNCTIVNGDSSASNLVIRNCLFDGFAQSGGAYIAASLASGAASNILVIDRQAAGGTGSAIAFGITGHILTNSTVINLNSNTGGIAVLCNSPSGTQTLTNNIIMGYSNPVSGASVASTIKNCCFSGAFPSGGQTDGGGNLLSKPAANQFVSATTDFRLKSGADCINAGLTDTTDIPAATDIAGTSRPQGASWDIGPWEFVTPQNNASSTVTLFAMAATAAASQFDQAHSANSITLASVVSMQQFDRASAAVSFAVIRAAVSMASKTLASAVAVISGGYGSGSSAVGDASSNAPAISGPATIYAAPSALVGGLGFSCTDTAAIGHAGAFVLNISCSTGVVYMLGSDGTLVSGSGTSSISYTTPTTNALSISQTSLASIIYVGTTASDTVLVNIFDMFGGNNTLSVPTISLRSPAALSSAVQQAPVSGIARLEVLSCVALSQPPPSLMTAVNYILGLSATSNVSQFVTTTGSASFLPVSCSASLLLFRTVSGLATIPAISSSVDSTQSDICTSTSRIVFSAAGTIVDHHISGLASFFVIQPLASAIAGCIAVANIDLSAAANAIAQEPSISNIMPMSCTAAMTSLTDASAEINFDVTSFISADSFTNASATADIVISNSILVQQQDLASSTSLFFKITSDAHIGTTVFSNKNASFKPKLCVLSTVASATLSDVVTVRRSILNLSIAPPAVLLQLQSEDFKNLTADGSGLLLKSDLYLPNMIQEDQASSTVTATEVSASGVLFKSITSSAALSIDIAASGVCDSNTNAIGTTQVLEMSAQGFCNVGAKFSGTVNIFDLSLAKLPHSVLLADPFGLILLAEDGTVLLADADIPQVTQQDQASSTTTIAISATGSAISAHVATCLQTIMGFAASAQGLQIDQASATIGIQISASGLVTPSTNASMVANIDWNLLAVTSGVASLIGLSNIDITSSIVAFQSDQASTATTIVPLSVSATAFNGDVASGSANLNLACVASAFLSYNLTVANNIDLTCSSFMAQSNQASASADITISSSITADQFLLASQINNIDITAIGLAYNSFVVSGVNSINFSAIGDSGVFGREIAGVATIESITSLVSQGQNNLVSGLASIVFRTSGGHLWETPTSFVEGDHIVWWSD